MSFPPPINEMMGMVLYLKEYKPHKEISLRTPSGRTFQAKIVYPKDDSKELIPNSIYRCEICPPKYSFRDGNCKYQFKKAEGGIEFNEKTIHYLESHPDKFPREWLIKIASFFGESSRL